MKDPEKARGQFPVQPPPFTFRDMWYICLTYNVDYAPIPSVSGDLYLRIPTGRRKRNRKHNLQSE